MIGLAILKSKLDAKIEKAQSYPVKDLTLWNMYTKENSLGLIVPSTTTL